VNPPTRLAKILAFLIAFTLGLAMNWAVEVHSQVVKLTAAVRALQEPRESQNCFPTKMFEPQTKFEL